MCAFDLKIGAYCSLNISDPETLTGFSDAKARQPAGRAAEGRLAPVRSMFMAFL